MSKIVITGMGAVTPVGIGVDEYWNGLLSGKCGIGPITRIPTDDLVVKNAGEVKGFEVTDYIPKRLASTLDTFMQYAYVSAEEAMTESGIDPAGERVGIVMGTALAGLGLIGSTTEKRASGKRTSPRFVSEVMGNIASAQLAITHGIKGPCMTVTTACSSGGDAVKVASMLMKAGEADVMIVMAGESALNAALIESLTLARALSKTGRSLPFDVDRDGFVMGEGGGAIVLETEEHAQARGAKIYAELKAVANTNDAFNVVSPEEDGAGAARCIKLALEQSGLKPEDIGYLNVHGTATRLGDIAEVSAIHTAFGDYAVPTSSTKGATGHMMGAGGLTELIACVKAIETGIAPPNTGMMNQDPELDVNLVTSIEKREIHAAMSNSLGFGGQNSCAIVARYEG